VPLPIRAPFPAPRLYGSRHDRATREWLPVGAKGFWTLWWAAAAYRAGSGSQDCAFVDLRYLGADEVLRHGVTAWADTRGAEDHETGRPAELCPAEWR
jgi:hypothetical protein